MHQSGGGSQSGPRTQGATQPSTRTWGTLFQAKGQGKSSDQRSQGHAPAANPRIHPHVSSLLKPPGYIPACPGVSPPPGYTPPFTDVSPPSGYTPEFTGVSPPSGYTPEFTGVSPPSGYTPAFTGVSPPPGYTPAFTGVSPPSRYTPAFPGMHERHHGIRDQSPTCVQIPISRDYHSLATAARLFARRLSSSWMPGQTKLTLSEGSKA